MNFLSNMCIGFLEVIIHRGNMIGRNGREGVGEKGILLGRKPLKHPKSEMQLQQLDMVHL